MRLSVRRSQRDAGMLGSKIIFALDARIYPTAEEQALIRRYKLGKLTIYSSEAAQKNAAAVAMGLAKGGIAGLAKATVSAGMTALSLRCTIDSLVAGQHIECQDMPQLLAAEDAIVAACTNARQFIETASTFDGRELVMDF